MGEPYLKVFQVCGLLLMPTTVYPPYNKISKIPHSSPKTEEAKDALGCICLQGLGAEPLDHHSLWGTGAGKSSTKAFKCLQGDSRVQKNDHTKQKRSLCGEVKKVTIKKPEAAWDSPTPMALQSSMDAISLEQGSGHAEQLMVQKQIVTDHARCQKHSYLARFCSNKGSSL
ncbi:hypothetical protein Anapl_03746 [Anas platyrhynchos]|uniref:Uncharacterized protein n=1 Tax=Anas platyrhynchos TaxID=8839 RepID=R0LWW3_ANAPL|nr:hypothetical protein Anapl_03746 [Anas platyrhynchos]